jgi:competence protein ComFC
MAMPPHRYQVYRTFWKALDWLFPPLCAGCEKPGERWCVACRASLRPLNGPLCALCGHQVSSGKYCPRCTADPPLYQQSRGWGRYEGALKKTIHRLKYKRDLALGDTLAQPMIELFQSLSWPVDLVVPVPLSQIRRRERGYNQAALLAYPIALYHGLEYNSATLTRIRDTRSQVNLTEVERQQNVVDAFAVRDQQVEARGVLSVDDVSTTSSTLKACAAALMSAGAASVYCLMLAMAERAGTI